jgi:hypothetical protein
MAFFEVELSPHRLFQLLLAGVAVAGEHLFGFPHGNLQYPGPVLVPGQQNDPGHFSQGQPRLGIALQRKNILHHHEIRVLLFQYLREFGKMRCSRTGKGRFSVVMQP